MSHDIDVSVLSLRDTLDLAIAIEEEAKERYDEFAEQLDAHHTPEVAKFFRFMSDNEVKHAEVLSAKRAELFGTEPATADTSAPNSKLPLVQLSKARLSSRKTIWL